MNFLSLIESKRDGRSLTAAQLREMVSGVVAGRLPDYQIAAFLMAVFFRGLSPAETTALTLAMRDSGDLLKFPADQRPLVDKHSTGGVGDKVSLPLAPLLACLGFRVPMISGRGLGITGGTLDKLDAIPGFQTLLPARRITEIVQEVGCVICGQTDRMVPADKKLYALRDVTGTVPSLPLITASILSKKLAENLDALILDVKFGAAAFMPTRARARELARAMVALGRQCGVNTRAVLTDMNTPLGRAAGNWLEVKECVAILAAPHLAAGHPAPEPLLTRPAATLSSPSEGEEREGRGVVASKGTNRDPGQFMECLPIRRVERPGAGNDVRELVLTFAAHLLVQTGRTKSLAAARRQAEACLDSGAPRKKWNEMLAAQGADLAACHRKLGRDHTAPVVMELQAARSGFVSRCDARLIGEVIRELGGGRLTRESVINADVGLDQIVKPGEPVKSGGALARIHAASRAQASAACGRLRGAFEISRQRPRRTPLISGIITS